jgi:cytoskeleton protein RodZ
MGSFGERMQREREMRRITIEEIAESTKIGSRMLRALEDEDFDKLPGGIFNKGFVRAYTKYLGIDEEQAVADFEKAVEDRKRRSAEKASPLQPELFSVNGRPAKVVNIYAAAASQSDEVQPEPDQLQGFLVAGVVLVILLGIGGLGYKYWSEHRQNKTTEPVATEPAPAKASAPAPEVQPPVTQSTNNTTAPTDEKSTAQQIAAPSQTTPAVTQPANQAPIQVANPATNQATSQSQAASSSSPEFAPVALQVNANSQTWIQVKADGKTVLEGIFSSGAKREFDAQKELVIKLGNAEAVELAFKGQKLPQFPSGTKTKTLTFTPQGLKQ